MSALICTLAASSDDRWWGLSTDFWAAIAGALVGGLITGAFTIVGLRWTFRTDRRAAADALLSQALWTMQAAAWEVLRWNALPRGLSDDHVQPAFRDLTRAATEAVARSRAQYRPLADLLMEAVKRVGTLAERVSATRRPSASDRKDVENHIAATTAIVGRWTNDPEALLRDKPTFEQLIDLAKADS